MEAGAIITTGDIEEEGTCGDRDTAIGGEPGGGGIGRGESGGVGESREHWETM